MRAIIRNNFRRLQRQKQLIILLVIFTAIAGTAAILVSTSLKTTWKIAAVSDQPMPFEAGNENVDLIRLDAAPKRSALVTGTYDAILTVNQDGIYRLDTIKSKETAKQIEAALKGTGNAPDALRSRGTGVNMIGFLMMFLLLMGSMAMCMYSDDKEGKQMLRVAASPVKISTCLLAHSIFNFCFLFIPTVIILTVLHLISGADYGCSFGIFAGLIAMICAFSTSFSLFLYSLLSNRAESAKMIGNTVIILTSILAGSFYAFDKANPALKLMVAVLPQKACLTLAEGLEQHGDFRTWLPAFIWLLSLTVVFFVISVIKTKGEYVNAR